jgi:hypothetical protein
MKKGRRLVVSVIILTGMFAFSSICASGPVMVEKNLFAQDRKPPSPDATPATPQSAGPGLSIKSVQLDGVFIHGDTKKALVRYKGGGGAGKDRGKGKQASPFTTVQEGEKLGDFLVKKIEPRSISLEKDGQTVVVGLFAEGKVVPPAPPMPAMHGGGGDPNRQRGGAPGQPGQPGHPAQRGVRGNELPGAIPPGAPHAPLAEDRMQVNQQGVIPDEDLAVEDEQFIDEGMEEEPLQ